MVGFPFIKDSAWITCKQNLLQVPGYKLFGYEKVPMRRTRLLSYGLYNASVFFSQGDLNEPEEEVKNRETSGTIALSLMLYSKMYRAPSQPESEDYRQVILSTLPGLRLEPLVFTTFADQFFNRCFQLVKALHCILKKNNGLGQFFIAPCLVESAGFIVDLTLLVYSIRISQVII